MRGFLTRQRYKVATVFVDHYSRLSFVYLQKSTSGEETVQAKRAFKAYAHSHGVTVLHYHADNGRFADIVWRSHMEEKGQSISYSGVNAHFQNALAEKRIQDLQHSARTMLVHAKHRWPRAINSHLWPYALRMANDVHMNTPTQDRKAPIELFSSISSATDPKHYHPFGCPVYVLSAQQQTDGKGAKWRERARVGINIGNSPVHSRNVALVLSTETGYASPQFHVKHDDLFETAHLLNVNIKWQARTRFNRKVEGEGSTEEQTSPDSVNLPPLVNKPVSGDLSAQEAISPAVHEPADNNDFSKGASPETTQDAPRIAPDSTFDIGSPINREDAPGKAPKSLESAPPSLSSRDFRPV
jgi:hypothetical protein